MGKQCADAHIKNGERRRGRGDWTLKAQGEVRAKKMARLREPGVLQIWLPNVEKDASVLGKGARPIALEGKGELDVTPGGRSSQSV